MRYKVFHLFTSGLTLKEARKVAEKINSAVDFATVSLDEETKIKIDISIKGDRPFYCSIEEFFNGFLPLYYDSYTKTIETSFHMALNIDLHNVNIYNESYKNEKVIYPPIYGIPKGVNGISIQHSYYKKIKKLGKFVPKQFSPTNNFVPKHLSLTENKLTRLKHSKRYSLLNHYHSGLAQFGFCDMWEYISKKES